MRTITAILAAVGLLMATGLTVGLEPAPVQIVVPSGYVAGIGHGHQYQHNGQGYQYEGYGANHSAFSAMPCAAPQYGTEDLGRQCYHWRNSCCDDAWVGYCGEKGLLGYRTPREHCGPGGCGGQLFSLFRWSQPAADYPVETLQPEPTPAMEPATPAPKSPEA
jgi:hypothetical protein